MVWDVTVVDALAPSRVNLNTNAGDAAEQRKNAKYQNLSDRGYIFQPLAFEAQGNYGESTLKFVSELGKRLFQTTKEKRSKFYLTQRISITLQQFNNACITGTVGNTEKLDKIFEIF